MKKSADISVPIFLISGRKTYKKGMVMKMILERIQNDCEKENILRKMITVMRKALPILMEKPLSMAR